MRYLPLIFLLLAAPVSAEILSATTNSGSISACVGTDRLYESSAGGGTVTYDLPDDAATDNWNTNVVGGTTRDGAWDCIVAMIIGSGGGGPNRMTLSVDRVNSSCVVQENIFTEETGTLTKGSTTVYECTGAASKSVTFAAGDAIMFTIWQSNGSQTIVARYNSTGDLAMPLTIPDAAATPTATATATATATPTAVPPTPTATATPAASTPTATPLPLRMMLIQ